MLLETNMDDPRM